MSATYNTRIISKLNDLARILDKHNYHNEATAIKNIASKISNWKEDREWNPENPLSIPDADNVLEDIIGKFKITMSDVEKREMAAKRPVTSGGPISNLEEMVKELEEIL